MVRKLVTFMTAVLLIITPLAANALGFGAIKLKSALNERFDAEVEVLSPTPEDIKSLKVKLASQAAFLRAGIERTALDNSLLFEIKERPSGSYFIQLSSKGTIREPFLNFLLEMTWKNGRMLREYTVLLDPPGRLTAQQQAPQPAVVEAPATAAPAAVEQVEAEQTAAPQPFVPAPLAEPTPLVEPSAPKPADEFQLAENEQLPRVNISEYKESDAQVKEQQKAAAEEKLPEMKHEPVMAEPDIKPEPEAAPLAEPSPLAEPVAGDMVADSQPFAGDELFPTIPLTAYREGAVAQEMTGELDYGITSKNDNLWGIAERMRPSEDVSIYQVMMALAQANPDAFVDGNIHRLKVGHVLRIDDPALFAAMSKQQAANEYQAQTREWDEFRQAAAGSVEEQPVIATQVESETVVAEPETKGELTLASPETTDLKSGTGVSEDAISNDLATLKAELDQMREQASAAQGKNESLNSRIRELEDQLADTQRTISIKDDELAALQQQLADIKQQQVTQAPEPAPVAEEPQPTIVTQPEPVAEPPVAEMAEEVKPEEPAPAIQPEAAEESPVQIAERIAEEEKVTPTPVQAPAPAKDEGIMGMAMGWLDEAGKMASNLGAAMGGVLGGGMTMYIVIGAVVFFVILLLILFKRRKQGESFQESILKGTPSDSPTGSDVPSADLAASEESSFLSDFAVSGAGAIQTEDSEVDPLTEADVFMAYGRHEAAEERLQEAIQAEPDRHELKLKLLELYKTTQNTSAFESTAEDIYASLGGNTDGNPTWEKVVALGKQVLPDNPLFSGTGMTAELDAVSAPAQEMGAGLTESQVMDIGLETGAFSSEDFSTPGMASESAEEELDFNLDLGESTGTGAAEEESAMMDFDLDLGSSAGAEESAEEATSDDIAAMDFDLDMGDLTSVDETPAEISTSEPEEAAGLDFNLDMDTTTGDESLASVEETDSTMMMDLGEDLGLDLGSAESDTSDTGDIDMSSEGDEVGTKLDLAKAYIDMGDPEGARSILDEVLEEGNEQQKTEAEQLMQQIA